MYSLSWDHQTTRSTNFYILLYADQSVGEEFSVEKGARFVEITIMVFVTLMDIAALRECIKIY